MLGSWEGGRLPRRIARPPTKLGGRIEVAESFCGELPFGSVRENKRMRPQPLEASDKGIFLFRNSTKT